GEAARADVHEAAALHAAAPHVELLAFVVLGEAYADEELVPEIAEILREVELRVVVLRGVRFARVVAVEVVAGPVGGVRGRRGIVEVEAVLEVPGVAAEIDGLDEGLGQVVVRRAHAGLAADAPALAAIARTPVRALGLDERSARIVVEDDRAETGARRGRVRIATVAGVDDAARTFGEARDARDGARSPMPERIHRLVVVV